MTLFSETSLLGNFSFGAIPLKSGSVGQCETKRKTGGEGREWTTKGIILTANKSSLKGNVVISGKTCSRRIFQLGLNMK